MAMLLCCVKSTTASVCAVSCPVSHKSKSHEKLVRMLTFPTLDSVLPHEQPMHLYLLQLTKQSSGAAYLKKRKEKDYAFRRQFNEKPSIIPGCPELLTLTQMFVFAVGDYFWVAIRRV
jgi:hypothetical protein